MQLINVNKHCLKSKLYKQLTDFKTIYNNNKVMWNMMTILQIITVIMLWFLNGPDSETPHFIYGLLINIPWSDFVWVPRFKRWYIQSAAILCQVQSVASNCVHKDLSDQKYLGMLCCFWIQIERTKFVKQYAPFAF